MFVERLLRALFEPRIGRELLARYLGARARARRRTSCARCSPRRRPAAALGAGPSPAAVAEAVRASLGGTWLQLSSELGMIREKWSWGRLHPLRFRALSRGAGSGGALGPFPYAGDGASVQVADHRPLESFDVRTVASFRFAIDAAALDEALASLAPGRVRAPGPSAPRRRARCAGCRGGPSLLATSRLVVEETAVRELCSSSSRRPEAAGRA